MARKQVQSKPDEVDEATKVEDGIVQTGKEDSPEVAPGASTDAPKRKQRFCDGL